MATKVQIATDVVQELGKLGAGETIATEDQTLVESVIDKVHGMLRLDGKAPWETSAVPDYAVIPFVNVLQAFSANKFGVAPDKELHNKGMRELAKQGARNASNQPTPALYF